MNHTVKYFIETNCDLLDTDSVEFWHKAENELSIVNQGSLVEYLEQAGFKTEQDRERVLRYIITMQLFDVTSQTTLRAFIARYLTGILGFDADWLFDYIIDNKDEWDVNIETINGTTYITPQGESAYE